MDQNASSEVEELEASYRLLDEKRRRLEAQKEQGLQQAHRSYEVDRTADHEDIKEKELALQEFKEKYYSELRNKEEALQMAYQREVTRKRKHEAEIEQFNQELSRLQRRKPNDLGFQGRPETPRTSISPSTLAQDLGQHSPIEFGPRTVGAHASPRAQNWPNSDKFDSPAKSRPEQTSQGRKECSGLLGKLGNTVVESSMEQDHTTIVRTDTEEGLKSNLPQPDVHLDENDLSAWSEFADTSGDDINSEDEERMNRDEASRQSRSLPLTERTIPYEEVYRAAQDPQAEYKHWIVEYPKGCGTWYIVRCVKHGLNWHNNPLPAAGKHILGPMHKCSSGKASLAIKELGERVIGCDQQKARASNAEYKNSLDLGYKPRKHMKQDRLQIRQKSAQKTTKHRPGNELSNEFDITDPVVGEVYQAWWDGEDTGWYLVVILPYSGDSDWKEVGMTGSLFTSGLAKEIPNCFKVVKTATNSGQEISRLTWAQGFQDGGPRVRSRKFPCLFLHPPLEIPTADQRFEIDAKAKVLAFRTAHQLRHQSTIHSIALDTRGIEAYQGLAREFKARLKEIRAKQDSAPGREVDHGSSMGAPSMKDRQRPNDTASVENMEDTGLSTDSNILQDPHQHANRRDLSMPRDGSGDSTVLARFTPKSPGVSLPSNNGNSSIGEYGSKEGTYFDQSTATSTYHPIPSTQSTTDRHSLNGEDDGLSVVEAWTSNTSSRQAQSITSQQKASPLVWQDTSSNRRTIVRPSQNPRASSPFQQFQVGGVSPVQGVADLSNENSHNTDTADCIRGSKRSRPSQSLHGKVQEGELRLQHVNDVQQDTDATTASLPPSLPGLRGTTSGNESPFGARDKGNVSKASTLVGKPRGPTALLPASRFRKENAQHSDRLPEANGTSSLGNTLSAVGGDAGPSSVVQTSWSRTYSEML